VSRGTAPGAVPAGAVDHLRGSDLVLRSVVDRVGPFEPSHEPDLWTSLVDSIISQQLSVRAAATIVGRVRDLGGEAGFPGPEALLATPDETLRTCGLSRAKTRYVKDLAEKWTDGTLQPATLASLPDEQVIAELTRVKGIGRWTAEMVLIFSLGRPDVLPVDDLGLRAAVQRAYTLPEKPGPAEITAFAEPWRPYRSVATLYLWRSLKV
jgi:DNA-3-methyladenine glycosylase II